MTHSHFVTSVVNTISYNINIVFLLLIIIIISSSSNIILRAVDGKNSNWLTVMPIARHHFDLSAVEFRDALASQCHNEVRDAL